MSTSLPRDPAAVDLQAPLQTFADCHVGITAQLDALAQLPSLLEPARRAHEIASTTVTLFERVVLAHHAEEEGELFPAVLRASHHGEERERVRDMIERLVREHRQIEACWRALEPGLKAVARGEVAEVRVHELQGLVEAYQAHAGFEESAFLPLCEQILGRGASDLGVLGLSIHMRRHLVDDGY